MKTAKVLKVEDTVQVLAVRRHDGYAGNNFLEECGENGRKGLDEEGGALDALEGLVAVKGGGEGGKELRRSKKVRSELSEIKTMLVYARGLASIETRFASSLTHSLTHLGWGLVEN